MTLTKPYWIVIEGIDKVGKSTLTKHLLSKIWDITPSGAITTREPGARANTTCLCLREAILSERYSPLQEMVLFMADRAIHEVEVVQPMLALGRTVIQDRGPLSTYVYQVCGTIKGQSTRHNMLFASLEERPYPNPDILVVCTADKDVLSQRVTHDHRLESERVYWKAYEDYNKFLSYKTSNWTKYFGNEIIEVKLNTKQDTDIAVDTIIDTIKRLDSKHQ